MTAATLMAAIFKGAYMPGTESGIRPVAMPRVPGRTTRPRTRPRRLQRSMLRYAFGGSRGMAVAWKGRK